MKPLPFRSVKKTLTQCILVFCCALLFSGSVAGLSIYVSMTNERDSAKQIALIVAGKIKNTLETKLYTTETMAALVKEHQGEIDDLATITEQIIAIRDVDSISLAPNGIIQYTYPYIGNESTIHHDLLHDEQRATEAIEAKESGILTISGPYDLRQGFYGVIGRQAVYFKNDAGEDVFWGFTCVTLRLPDALKEADLASLKDKQYNYEIWRINPDTDAHQTILSDGQISQDAPIASIQLPNATWYLSISLEHGFISLWNALFRFLLALIFAGLVAALFGYVRFLAYSRNNLRISLEQQAENYHQINEKNEELRVFRHDMKNHFLALFHLLQEHQIDEAESYIKNISGQMTFTAPLIDTNNYVFDALIAEKKVMAQQANILMNCELYIQRKLEIENVDWSILFGNLLDNAIEACLQDGITRPYINLQVLCKGNLMHVKISNSALCAPTIKGGKFISTKQDSKQHGKGMKQIQAIIKKYHGTMLYTFENQEFTISFMLIDI